MIVLGGLTGEGRDMTHMGGSSVQVAVWVGIDDRSEIAYQVYPVEDIIELTLGGCDGLAMQTSEAGLRRCVAEFTGALEEFEAAAASQG